MTYKEKIKELRNSAQETQSAIKIKDKLTELKAKNNSISSYRWIWELIQNAKDCTNSSGKIDIEIVYNESTSVLEFKHNGKLFSTKNIIYLVEQVSTKERTFESKSTGKFGTGFLTTHLLSPKVSVSGYLCDEDNESPVPFCVEIDRSSKDLNEIKESIRKSCEQLENIIDTYAVFVEEKQMNTVFKYKLDEEGIKVAENGLKNFIITVPYVFAFVSELNKIVLNYNGEITEYTRQEKAPTQVENGYVSRILNSKSKKTTNIFTLSKDNVVLAAEIEQRDHKNYIVKYDSELPKLFCDFPLLGTHDFSFPVVINSQLFNPNEPRNGIFLADNDESKENKALLLEACELYISFIGYFLEKGYEDIYNVVIVSDVVEKEWIDVDWYNEDILALLKDKISEFPMFKMCDNTIKPLEDEWGDHIYLLKESDEIIRESIWKLSSQMCPEKHVQYNYINNWYNSLWSECKNYSLVDLIVSVEQCESLNKLSEKVSDPIRWINELIGLIYVKCKDDHSIVNRVNKIFPNQNGIFCCKEDLKIDSGIDEAYKQAALLIEIDFKDKLLDQRINVSEIPIMSFDEAVYQMINRAQYHGAINLDFYKTIIGIAGDFNKRQDELINIYNKLYSNSPVNVVNVKKYSQRLLDLALEFCSEDICRTIECWGSLSMMELFSGLTNEDEIKEWIDRLVQYIVCSNKTEWLERYAIIPNQKGDLRKKSDLFIDTDDIPDFLKITCVTAGKDIKEELASSEIDLSKVISRKKGYKDVSDIITNYVRSNKNQISLVGEQRKALDETYFWLRKHKEDPTINHYFEELMQHLYWFYNDEEISKNIEKASKCDSLLQRYGISDLNELEKILSDSNDMQSKPTVITEEILCQYGIDSEDDLKQLIEGKILGEGFIHESEKDFDKYIFVQELLKRSHDSIKEYLRNMPEYDLDDSIDVHKTIFTAKKNGKEIYIIARPSDYDEVILYYGAEIDTLDYSQDFELWVENGKSKPQKLTFGRILRLTGVNRIPLRSII